MEKPETQEDTSAQEPAAKPPPTPEERIASGLEGIKFALGLIAFIMLTGQCSGSFVPDKREEALKDIAYELRLTRQELNKVSEASGSLRAAIDGVNRTLSNINSTIWDKSCSP